MESICINLLFIFDVKIDSCTVLEIPQFQIVSGMERRADLESSG